MDKNKDGKTTEQLIEEEMNGNSDDPTKTKSSEKGTGESVPPKVKLSDGREVTPEQLLEEYNSLHSDYTRKTQELSQIKQTVNQSDKDKGNTKPTLSAKDQEILKDLKEKFGVITQDDLEQAFSKKEPDFVSKAARVSITQSQLNEALDELEEDYDGREEKIGDVKITMPKVEKQKVLDFIVQNPGTRLTPLQIAKAVYQDDFIKYESKRLSVSNGSTSKSLPKTEGSTGSDHEPAGKKPVSFRDGSAENAVREMIGA